MRGLLCSREWRLIAQGKAIIASALITGLQKELAVKPVSLLCALMIKKKKKRKEVRKRTSEELLSARSQSSEFSPPSAGFLPGRISLTAKQRAK